MAVHRAALLLLPLLKCCSRNTLSNTLFLTTTTRQDDPTLHYTTVDGYYVVPWALYFYARERARCKESAMQAERADAKLLLGVTWDAAREAPRTSSKKLSKLRNFPRTFSTALPPRVSCTLVAWQTGSPK